MHAWRVVVLLKQAGQVHFYSTHSPVITTSVAAGTFPIELYCTKTLRSTQPATCQNKTARVFIIAGSYLSLCASVLKQTNLPSRAGKSPRNTVQVPKTKNIVFFCTSSYSCDSVDRQTGGLTYLLMIFRSRLKSIL